ncbi:sodium:proton antiporter [Actinomyces sp. B33]|uniref:sodium:proton antiporter n=1 Tax=Actinomyces sp. B33 TaxID=2942131 RepID=UPI0023402127|nr:sodium:proton antiporter [Actinomyces sp. B33]MDC4232709.1 sodium:proton antiporter [Actinomyces sp. B33]
MTYQWWCLIPFIAMLASIALLPIIPATSHWWEKNSSQLIVALALGVPTTIWMWATAGPGSFIATAVEYIQFIALLFALFVVSGGIHLEGDIQATPRNNTIFLAIGGLLASFIGTTGAAMLLIRPLLATNKERVHRVHTVLFTIFVVANCGGLLTPLGDPPLFLGFLHGVPFTWTLGLVKEWAFVLVLLLATYYSIDSVRYASENPASLMRDDTEITPLRLRGGMNLLLFGVIILAVAFIPSWDGEALAEGHAHGAGLIPWRELVMAGAAGASYVLGDRDIRFRDNAFTWAPIAEVATLFIGIFTTMAPALRYLEQIAPSLPLTRMTFFLFTGGLSSILDNAPTYMTFFEMAKALGGADPLIAGVPEHYLVPISLGAVLCGAITYIGNGPNFMVKSVAEADGVAMPSFGHYIAHAFALLVPILAAMALIFIAESTWAHASGWGLTLALLALVGVRLLKARKAEGVAGFTGEN